MTPAEPPFVTDPNDDWIALEPVRHSRRTTRLGILGPRALAGYDANQIKWAVTYQHPEGFHDRWARLMPMGNSQLIETPVVWSEIGTYPFTELQDLFLRLVQTNAHLIRLVAEDEFNRRVRRAAQFQELVAIWRWTEGVGRPDG